MLNAYEITPLGKSRSVTCAWHHVGTLLHAGARKSTITSLEALFVDSKAGQHEFPVEATNNFYRNSEVSE